MTNDTELHQNGVADDLPALAAVSTETTHTPPTETIESAQAAPVAETAVVEPPVVEPPVVEPPPAEVAAPSFDDLGLHPDVKLALDDMGYFTPTAV